jgi:hypothetical protein
VLAQTLIHKRWITSPDRVLTVADSGGWVIPRSS